MHMIHICVEFNCGQVFANFTHILEDYPTVYKFSMPVKQCKY